MLANCAAGNETHILAVVIDLGRGNPRIACIPAAEEPPVPLIPGEQPQQEPRQPYIRHRVDEGPAQHRPIDKFWLGRQQLHPHLGPEREAHHVRHADPYPGADEFCHRSGGSAHLEWALLEAFAELRQIGDQTAVLRHSFDHGLPGPAAHIPAVKEDDSGRFDRTGFAHKQIHESDPMCS